MSPPHRDPVREAARRRRQEKRQAVAQLEALAKEGVRLPRRVFFVPGWADEAGVMWTKAFSFLPKGHEPVKAWLRRIVRNPSRVTFLQYSPQESKVSPTFDEFAELLKARIRRHHPSGGPMDLIGYSMGGLEIISAVTSGPRPLRNVVNAVAVASPLRGVFYGRFVRQFDRLVPFLRWFPHHYEQVRNMTTKTATIRRINAAATRQRLLRRIRTFTGIAGTQDFVVMRSARLRTKGMSSDARRRVRHLRIGGAGHVGPNGVTEDPRTVLALIKILIGHSTNGRSRVRPRRNGARSHASSIS